MIVAAIGEKLKLPAAVLALTALGLALAEMAHADRQFASERGLSVPAVAGAVAYTWEVSSDGAWNPLLTTTAPNCRISTQYRDWRTFRVTAVGVDGAREVSPATEPVRWRADPRCDLNQTVGMAEFGCLAQVFGLTNCAGEWKQGPCSCTEGGPCPPP